jgi:hypothetical protein
VSKQGVEAAVCLAFASRKACQSKAARDVEVDVEAMSKRPSFDTQGANPTGKSHRKSSGGFVLKPTTDRLSPSPHQEANHDKERTASL